CCRIFGTADRGTGRSDCRRPDGLAGALRLCRLAGGRLRPLRRPAGPFARGSPPPRRGPRPRWMCLRAGPVRARPLLVHARVRRARHRLFSVLLGCAVVLLASANLEYLIERQAEPDKFGSIPAALWWAIETVTTTGYGDSVPGTPSGRALAGVVMVCGILVLA